VGEIPSELWLEHSLGQFFCDLGFLFKACLGTLYCYWDFVGECPVIVSLPYCCVVPLLQTAGTPICVGWLCLKPFVVAQKLSEGVQKRPVHPTTKAWSDILGFQNSGMNFSFATV